MTGQKHEATGTVCGLPEFDFDYAAQILLASTPQRGLDIRHLDRMLRMRLLPWTRLATTMDKVLSNLRVVQRCALGTDSSLGDVPATQVCDKQVIQVWPAKGQVGGHGQEKPRGIIYHNIKLAPR